MLFKIGIWVLENDKQSFSHTSKFVDASYCKHWARCKLEGLMDGLRYGANGTFVSINLVSGVLMGSISTLELPVADNSRVKIFPKVYIIPKTVNYTFELKIKFILERPT